MVTPAAVPSGRRHRRGKVTLASVEAALAKLGAGASMRAVQGVTGGSLRDVHAVVHLVRGRASLSVQEAFVAGHPADFGQTLVDALRKLEDVAGEIRATQEQQRAQLAALEDTVRLRNRPRDDERLLRALDTLQHDLDSLRPDLAKVAGKDPMALRGLLAGLESRVIESIGEVSKAAPALITASLPQPEPELMKDLHTGVAAVQHIAAQIQVDQQQLASAVSALRRDLVERHAHHAQRLSESDAGLQRELAHVHRHLASLRTDVASLQAGVGNATDRLVQTARTQGATMRRTLRDLGLNQLRAAATTATAMASALKKLRQKPSATKRPKAKTKPAGKRIAAHRRVVKTINTTRKASAGTSRSTNQRRITVSGRARPPRASQAARPRAEKPPHRPPARARPRRG